MDVTPLADEGLESNAHTVDLRDGGALVVDAAEVAERPLLVRCGHGGRATSAASLLERAGHEDVAVLACGPDDLADAGHRRETEA